MVQWWQTLVYSNREVLELVVKYQAEACRKLLRRDGVEGPLCQALMRERLWRFELAESRGRGWNAEAEAGSWKHPEYFR